MLRKALAEGGAAMTNPNSVDLRRGEYLKRGLEYPMYIIPDT